MEKWPSEMYITNFTTSKISYPPQISFIRKSKTMTADGHKTITLMLEKKITAHISMNGFKRNLCMQAKTNNGGIILFGCFY